MGREAAVQAANPTRHAPGWRCQSLTFAYLVFGELAALARAADSGRTGCSRFFDTSLGETMRAELGVPEGYRRCALVGSSGLLLRQRVAEEIDSHDMVMRFNMAPVDGYEHVVGYRTTVRLLNSEAVYESLQCRVLHKNRTICPDYAVVLNCFRKDFAGQFRSECGAGGSSTTIVDADPLLSSPAVDSLKPPPPKHPMSGSIGLALALAVCAERVDLYGFTHRGTLPFYDQVKYHYYGEDEQKGWIDVLFDSLHESAALLSDFAEEEAMGCLHLNAPKELQPAIKPTPVANWRIFQDPLSEPPGGCGHSIATVSFPVAVGLLIALILGCLLCCGLCCYLCKPKKPATDGGQALE